METESIFPPDLQAQKKALRRQILQRREALTEQERRRGTLLITERILGHQWFYLSDCVLGFVGYGSEISTDEISMEVLRQGKHLYLPKVEGEQMQFYRVRELKELREGYKGIREPVGHTERYVCNVSGTGRTLMLMPGVAFDSQRNRMGYGKGFYDRFLADKPELQLRTIGIGYACQMVEQVPSGEQDIRPYQIICV
jgi:5-formyltetrahydrofolate cyclo-ligase